MHVIFDFSPDRCTACGACSVACMDQNDPDTEGGQGSFRRVFQWEEGDKFWCISLSCLHCAPAPCEGACPAHCIHTDPDTGLVLADAEACIGCRRCASVCPVGAPTFRQSGLARPSFRMEKCDGCLTRIQAGLEPACVRACPTGALTWRWGAPGERSVSEPLLREIWGKAALRRT